MNAHLTDQQLNAYLHQTLNDAQRETLDAHLTQCPVCRAQLSELAVLQQRLRRELAAELKAVNVPLSLTFETIAPRLTHKRNSAMPNVRTRNVVLFAMAASVIIVTLTLNLITRISPWPAPSSAQAVVGATPAPTTQALISATATPPAIEDISAVQFGGVATLVKPHLVQEKFLPGEAVPLTLDWTILIKFNQTYTSFAHVLDSQGNVVAQADLPLQAAALIDSIPASTGWNTPQGHITLPADLSPGQYKIAIGIYSNQTGQRLTTDQGETTTVIGTIEVVTPLARFGNTVALTDVELPVAKPAAGELLELSLHWLVSITNPLTLNTFVHVIDSQGNLATQADQALAPAETSVQTITLQLPTAMGAGDYQIVVGVYDTTTLSRLTTDKGETTATIGMVAIGVPPTRFGDVVTLADASLLMIGPAPSAAVELSLHWTISATNPTTLTTFVHVVDPQGNLIAQSDQPLTDRETSIQTITLQLPATLSSGTYQVVVGVYDTTTFLRLMTDVGETQIPLTSFQLKSK